MSSLRERIEGLVARLRDEAKNLIENGRDSQDIAIFNALAIEKLTTAEGLESLLAAALVAEGQGAHQEDEIIRLALEFVLANRTNAILNQDAEYRAMADACALELSKRAKFVKSVSRMMGRAVRKQRL